MEGNTELRKLPSQFMHGLCSILEEKGTWKDLMAIVPQIDVAPENPPALKYSIQDKKLIEQAADERKRPCAEIFLEEWSTSGRKRPNLSLLLLLLDKARLYRAADYITDSLKVPRLERPSSGPSAAIDVSKEAIEKLIINLPTRKITSPQFSAEELNRVMDHVSVPDGNVSSLDNLLHLNEDSIREYSRTPESLMLGEQMTTPVDEVDRTRYSSVPLNTSLLHIKYSDLEFYTNNFNDSPLSRNDEGRKLGSGAFGSVYLGIKPSGEHIAVKRLNKDAVNVEKQFRNEVESLSRFRHRNLLGLVGYSCDSDMYCLVYEYMSNGSLQSKLACKDGEDDVLHWQIRLGIALGTAYGIQYLHTVNVIHRDIKSANILLDEHLVPKLGDFGLVHLGQKDTVAETTTVFGTSAYMAPEAFRGNVSAKLDTFSFGVVLLEILTGLPPYDENRVGRDLVTHVEVMLGDTGTIEALLDKRADWGSASSFENTEVSNLADKVYAVACRCIEDNRHKRPTMSEVVQLLEDIKVIN